MDNHLQLRIHTGGGGGGGGGGRNYCRVRSSILSRIGILRVEMYRIGGELHVLI